jgi:hypothetical protein
MSAWRRSSPVSGALLLLRACGLTSIQSDGTRGAIREWAARPVTRNRTGSDGGPRRSASATVIDAVAAVVLDTTVAWWSSCPMKK